MLGRSRKNQNYKRTWYYLLLPFRKSCVLCLWMLLLFMLQVHELSHSFPLANNLKISFSNSMKCFCCLNLSTDGNLTTDSGTRVLFKDGCAEVQVLYILCQTVWQTKFHGNATNHCAELFILHQQMCFGGPPVSFRTLYWECWKLETEKSEKHQSHQFSLPGCH